VLVKRMMIALKLMKITAAFKIKQVCGHLVAAEKQTFVQMNPVRSISGEQSRLSSLAALLTNCITYADFREKLMWRVWHLHSCTIHV